jgi:ribosomal protein S11
MRVVRKEKKNKNKNKKQVVEQKKVYIPWKIRSKKYSEYPYIVTVSFFKKNVFLSASDLRGRIKYWTNAGRLGFKGRDKTQFLALITIAQNFFKKLTRYGIRDVFLKFKNFKRTRYAIKKAIRKSRILGWSKRGFRRSAYKKVAKWRWKWIERKGKKKIKKRRKIWVLIKRPKKNSLAKVSVKFDS